MYVRLSEVEVLHKKLDNLKVQNFADFDFAQSDKNVGKFGIINKNPRKSV